MAAPGIAAAAAGAVRADEPGTDATDVADGNEAVPIPFHGTHQAGIDTPEQNRLVVAAYDVIVGNRAELAQLLSQWTAAAARMTSGLPLSGPGGEFAPPADTGEALGLPASRLTLTVGFGPSLFDDRFGLGSRRPEALVDLPPFPGDDLEPARSGGDLCIQACSDDAQVAFHAVRNLTRLALGSATLRYLQTGFGRTASAGGRQPTPRNLLGFHDGTNNLDPTDQEAMDRFVWVGSESDQSWMAGGTYLVARRIRTHLEAWDRSTLEQQQQTIGREKASGALLGGVSASDPLYLEAQSPDGELLIPNTAHVRLASPTTNGGQAILRRGYSFLDGTDPDSGELDSGLFFVCFQKDPRSQFIPIQQRLAQLDALCDFIVHTGSGIFACPPGIQPGQRWGHDLL